MALKGWTGGHRPEWTASLCAFSEERGGICCNRDATWHGFIVRDYGVKAMSVACDTHEAALRASFDYVHQFTHPCCIPGSRFRWPENECYTEWDDAELTAATLEMAGGI